MDSNAVATRRHMVKYDKKYKFTPNTGMNVFAVIDGQENDVDDLKPLCSADFPHKGFFRKKDYNQFYLIEIRKEFDVDMQCQKFGLSSGVRLRLRPHTRSRGVSLVLLKYGTKVTEGNEDITYCCADAFVDLLQESFDSAVNRLGGQVDDEYFGKLVEKLNGTDEFVNCNIEVVSAVKIE